MMSITNTAQLARELVRTVTELRTHLRQFLQAKIREHHLDLSFELIEVMAVLWRQDGINQQVLADTIVKDKSSMVYLIDNLIKRDLVYKAQDEKDKRNKLIFVTDEGKQLQKKLNPLIIEMYESSSEGISTTELKKAIETVIKISNRIKR
jgi:DNA-binding MarR family transcriptional regulator